MSSTTLGRQAHGKNMCLRSNECVGPVLRSLEQFVPIETQGRWTQKDVYQRLIGMAAERQSVHSLHNMVYRGPCETSMRHHFKKLDMEQILGVNHMLLAEQILDVLPKGKECIFAIDTTDDPYYGRITPVNKRYVVGGKRKKSTNRFYRYITLYLVERDRKFTLAVLPVQRDVPVLDYVKQLLGIIENTGLKTKVLLLDRGFYTSEVLSYLQHQDIPHIVPVKKHGEEMKRLLSAGKRSRFARYTMGGSYGPLELRIAIAVKYQKGRRNKHGQLHLGYAIHGITWKPHKIAKLYRKRFSIESSYRMRNTVRPRTTTKNPTLRYLLALISLLLKNIWVAIRWRHFTTPKQGPRQVQHDTFRFDHFRLMIWTAIANKLGFRTHIPVLRPKG